MEPENVALERPAAKQQGGGMGKSRFSNVYKASAYLWQTKTDS